MKKIILTSLVLITTFMLGFALSQIMTPTSKGRETKRVTGIGGVFFKCKDPNKLKEWYKTHLGFKTDQYGTIFEWQQSNDSTVKGITQWGPFSDKTKYFEPSTKEFMFNYIVEDLIGLVEQLKIEGVTIVDTIETYEYGKFIHIMDLEGNKIELWEPDNSYYTKWANENNK